MDLKDNYLNILKSNQRSMKEFRYTVPSSSVHPHQWLWDSCFHAIIYARFKEFDCAKDEIRSLLSDQWENGMVPHMIYWTDSDKHKYNVNWGTEKNTSSMTQPPMIAYAIERIYDAVKDREFVKEIFEKVDRYYKWLHNERSDDYILSVIHPWETGEDDFVSWDSVYGIRNPSKETLKSYKLNILKKYIDTGLDSRMFMKKNLFNVKCLLFNSVYLRNLRSMLHLAEIINSKEVEYYKNIIPKVIKSYKRNFYNKKVGLYSSYYNKKRYVENSENASIFLPFFAGMYTKLQAKKVVKKYLLDKSKFWLKYPVPTISADNANFEPNRYWRGSVWVNINWFIVQGLNDYGYGKIAEDLKKRTMGMIKKSGFCEYYNPITGDGLGPKDFTWSGLVFDM